MPRPDMAGGKRLLWAGCWRNPISRSLERKDQSLVGNPGPTTTILQIPWCVSETGGRPLTVDVTGEGLADHPRVVLLVRGPLVDEQGGVRRARIKHQSVLEGRQAKPKGQVGGPKTQQTLIHTSRSKAELLQQSFWQDLGCFSTLDHHALCNFCKHSRSSNLTWTLGWHSQASKACLPSTSLTGWAQRNRRSHPPPCDALGLPWVTHLVPRRQRDRVDASQAQDQGHKREGGQGQQGSWNIPIAPLDVHVF